MRLLNQLFTIILGCLLFSGMAYAQGVGASGDITGTVSDPSGAVISNATVTVTDVEKGIKRTATTSNGGQYRLPSLPPAVYSVGVSKAGFQSEISKSVIVTIGQTTFADFHLKVSQVSEQVEVTTEPPIVETERGHQSNVITEELITDLPINRRDYLTFTLLAPGISDATRLAGDQDFRVKQTPQSGLALYGSNGRGNSATVDGGEVNDDSGGVRLNVSQEAVQEFQINRSNYGADLGGASGASLNIVTKSGTNSVHGSLFTLFRFSGLDAADPFAFTQALAPGQTFNPAAPDLAGRPSKDDLSRQQFGGSIGFPITKDKTFIFGAFEGLHENRQKAVPLLTNTSVFRPGAGEQAILGGLANQPNSAVPCLTGQPALPSATCAGILTNILTVNPAASPLNSYLVNQFESNGGLFPYNQGEYFGSVRLDHQFGEMDQGSIRYNFAHDQELNPDVQSQIGFSNGSLIHAFDHTIQGSWIHQFSPKTLNELRAQFNYSNFDVVPNSPGQAGLLIPGFASLGTNIFLPNFTRMRRPELADNITMIRGHHTLKFGAYELYRGNHTESHTFFPGRFVFGNLPGGILSPCLQVPAACATSGTSTLLTATPAPLDALQGASLGLPQFYQQGFGNPIYKYPRPWTAFYAQDQWQMFPNLTFTYGLRYELDAQYGKLTTYKKNFGPRASFAWDPFKDHKTAVRGGYGIFYSPIYGQIADVVQTLGVVNGIRPIAQVFVPLTGAPGNPALTSAAIFQTLFAQGKIQCAVPAPGNAACITPADLTQFGITITNSGPIPPLTVLFSGQPNYRNPYSQQASFGIDREISKGFSVSLSGIYVHTLHLPVAIDTNLLPAPTTTTTSPFNGKQVTFRNWASPQCAGNPFSCFANPLLLQNNQYSSIASALYEGGILEVKKRFSAHLTLLGNYTYSKGSDTATDFNSDFSPVDQTNLAGERGLSDFDQRHKIVVAAVADSPWKGMLSGFQASPIIRYNSGHPFNILASGTDLNGDRHSTNDRPIDVGRNSGRGPDFFAFDMRITKTFKFYGDKNQLQFTAEGFNLFNRTNYSTVNNEVPTLNGFGAIPSGATFIALPAHPSGAAVNPAQTPLGGSPLAFTNDFDKRQFQLGARFVF